MELIDYESTIEEDLRRLDEELNNLPQAKYKQPFPTRYTFFLSLFLLEQNPYLVSFDQTSRQNRMVILVGIE